MSKFIPISTIQSFKENGKKIGLHILTDEILELETVFVFAGFHRVHFRVMSFKGHQGNGKFGYYVENEQKGMIQDFADFVTAVRRQEANRLLQITITDYSRMFEQLGNEAAAIGEKLQEIQNLLKY